MKTLVVAGFCALLLGCAAQQPPSFTEDQAVGLTDDRAQVVKGAMEGGGGILYGDELVMGVQAPKGWIFDSKIGASQGLYAVMYPVGSTWASAPEIMYVNIAKLQSGETLEGFIDGDIELFKKNSPDLKVEAGPEIAIVGGEQAVVRFYSGDKWGNHEAVAYLPRGSNVAIYVLSCKTQAGFEKSLPAFREMVSKSFASEMRFESGK
jgi:hypothetical protein